MKKFVKSLLLGALILGGVSIAATSFNAEQASFPILINGSKWHTYKPVVVIDGSTYLPLRAMSEVLGVDINWNENARQVEINHTSDSLSTSLVFPPYTGYANVIKKMEKEFPGKLRYKLIYFDKDRVPELLVDNPDSWYTIYSGSYIWYDTKNDMPYNLEENDSYFAYGTHGRVNDFYLPMKSLVLSTPHDNVGTASEEYYEIGENNKLVLTFEKSYSIGEEGKVSTNGKLLYTDSSDLNLNNFMRIKGTKTASEIMQMISTFDDMERVE